jgi:hypothetical protein
MAGRRVDTMDLRELLRHIRADPSNRSVSRATGTDRCTVKRYRDWASEQTLLEGNLPPLPELQRLLDQTLPFPTPVMATLIIRVQLSL